MAIIDTDNLLASAARSKAEQLAEASRLRKQADQIENAAEEGYATVVHMIEGILAQVQLIAPEPDAPITVVPAEPTPPASMAGPAVRVPVEGPPVPEEGLTPAIRWAIGHFDGEFTTNDIAAFLSKYGWPVDEKRRGFMPSAFVKLVEQEEIVKLSKGSVGAPSRFRRNIREQRRMALQDRPAINGTNHN